MCLRIAKRVCASVNRNHSTKCKGYFNLYVHFEVMNHFGFIAGYPNSDIIKLGILTGLKGDLVAK